jgi:hypothetical protein
MRFSPRFVVCALMILLVAATAHAQTSGAMLTITGTLGPKATPVNIMIYDSQIHSGLVQPSPCDSQTTDAYVLQGGSPTGCAQSDLYEITDVASTTPPFFTARTDAATHQDSGAKPISPFSIETHFICVGKCANGVAGASSVKSFCNTSGTICIQVLNGNPADDGFIVVKNTGLDKTSDFTGTITLQGNSTVCGAASASDSLGPNYSLPHGQSVTLAMGKPGTVNPDSGTCAGFNWDQSQAITAGQPTTFLFGKDSFQVTPSDSNPGDVITFRPVPIAAGQFGVDPHSLYGQGQNCITFASFSALGNPICPEFETHCNNGNSTCLDAETFHWTGQLNFTVDANSLPSGVGGVHFLGEAGADCPTSTFHEDILLSFFGSTPGTDPPLLPGGSGLNCFVASYDPKAAPVAPNVQVSTFQGFFSPVQPFPTINVLNSGQNVSLNFFFANVAGGPGFPGLHWCPGGPTLPPGDPSVCSTPGVTPPWVAFLRTQLPGQNGCTSETSGYIGVPSPTNSFMADQGGGNYKFNWATDKTTDKCLFYVGPVFYTGLAKANADEFKFK